MKQGFFVALALILISSTLSQQIITGIQFECRGRVDGFWRDLRYCDVFHACVAGEQKRSYGCPQVGERFYFNEQTQRCEFASQNPGGCQSNQYYVSVSNIPTASGSQLSTQAPSEQWRIFVQSREQHNCAGQQDGFYASRWCNVFYRCSDGVSRSFICPLQQGGGRLWWVGHGSQQVMPETSAECVFPCDTRRQCSSPGGIIVDNGNQISESQQAAETAYRQSLCSNQTSQTGSGAGGISTGSGAGGISTGSGAGGISTGSGAGGISTGSGAGGVSVGSGAGGISTGFGTGVGAGQTGTGGSSGGSSNTASLINVDSDVSCTGQAEGVFLSSRYCNIFHRCVSGSRFDFRCARGNNVTYDLWWNQQTNLCDWPCRIQCSNPIFGSSTSAQQVQSESLVFFNNDCRAYPRIFNTNK